MRSVSAVIIVGLLGSTVRGQAPARPPVIDVHVHSTNTSPQQALERMKSLPSWNTTHAEFYDFRAALSTRSFVTLS